MMHENHHNTSTLSAMSMMSILSMMPQGARWLRSTLPWLRRMMALALIALTLMARGILPHLGKTLLILVSVVGLMGCQQLLALIDRDPEPLPGERVSIFSTAVQPSLNNPIYVEVPPPEVNNVWPVAFRSIDEISSNTSASPQVRENVTADANAEGTKGGTVDSAGAPTDATSTGQTSLVGVDKEAEETEEAVEGTERRLTTDTVNGHLALGKNVELVWRLKTAFTSDRRPMLARPLVVDGTIYMIDANFRVHAVALDSGRVQWSLNLEDIDIPPVDDRSYAKPTWFDSLITRSSGIVTNSGYDGGISLDNGVLYATTGAGVLVAIDTVGQKLLWWQNLSGPSHSAPAVTNGRVIAKTTIGSIEAFDAASGRRIWLRSLPIENVRLLHSPGISVASELLITPFGSGNVSAFRSDTGALVWNRLVLRTIRTDGLGTLTDFSADPLILPEQMIVGNNMGLLLSVNPATSDVLWQIDFPSPRKPWPAGKILFVVTNNGIIAAIDRRNGSPIWFQDLPRTADNRSAQLWHDPVLAGGVIWMVAYQGGIVQVSPIDGRTLSIDFKSTLFATGPVIVDRTLLLFDMFGEVFAYRGDDDNADIPPSQASPLLNPTPPTPVAFSPLSHP